MRRKWIGPIGIVLTLVSATAFRPAPEPSEDRAEIERVFKKYLQALKEADVELASLVWLQSPDVLVVTPAGRFNGWEGVKEIWAGMQKNFSERNVQPSNVSIFVAGDAAWLTSKGWESHGYLRTPGGWRIAQLHYSVPPPPS
jgi:ketosteroid isomerase-like protein